MLVSDLLHSCANDRVAAAAVLSIGGTFASRIQREADERGVTVGVYASRIVRDFADGAGEREWRDLVSAIRGQDHPVLSGLQVILDRRASGGRMADRGGMRASSRSSSYGVSATAA